MAEHPIDALSVYLDGDLDPAERAAIDRHLTTCAECRDVVADLRRLQAGAQEWAAREVVPPADLWTAVAARLEARPARTGAVVLPWYRRRWSVGVAELAVAATLVAAVTAGLTWSRSPGGPVPSGVDDPPPVLAELEPIETPAGAITTVSFADAQFDAAIADLERVLRDERRRLDPRTVMVLERNLQVIDDAIRDARTALADDPANALLNAHLASARQRKLNLLRRAANITEGD